MQHWKTSDCVVLKVPTPHNSNCCHSPTHKNLIDFTEINKSIYLDRYRMVYKVAFKPSGFRTCDKIIGTSNTFGEVGKEVLLKVCLLYIYFINLMIVYTLKNSSQSSLLITFRSEASIFAFTLKSLNLIKTRDLKSSLACVKSDFI
jgi:hypothetical protein